MELKDIIHDINTEKDPKSRIKGIRKIYDYIHSASNSELHEYIKSIYKNSKTDKERYSSLTLLSRLDRIQDDSPDFLLPLLQKKSAELVAMAIKCLCLYTQYNAQRDLLELFNTTNNSEIKNEISTALSVHGNKECIDFLIKEFKKSRDHQFRLRTYLTLEILAKRHGLNKPIEEFLETYISVKISQAVCIENGDLEQKILESIQNVVNYECLIFKLSDCFWGVVKVSKKKLPKGGFIGIQYGVQSKETDFYLSITNPFPQIEQIIRLNYPAEKLEISQSISQVLSFFDLSVVKFIKLYSSNSVNSLTDFAEEELQFFSEEMKQFWLMSTKIGFLKNEKNNDITIHNLSQNLKDNPNLADYHNYVNSKLVK